MISTLKLSFFHLEPRWKSLFVSLFMYGLIEPINRFFLLQIYEVFVLRIHFTPSPVLSWALNLKDAVNYWSHLLLLTYPTSAHSLIDVAFHFHCFWDSFFYLALIYVYLQVSYFYPAFLCACSERTSELVLFISVLEQELNRKQTGSTLLIICNQRIISNTVL